MLGRNEAALTLIAAKLYTTGNRNHNRVFNIAMLITSEMIKLINDATLSMLRFCPLALKIKSLSNHA